MIRKFLAVLIVLLFPALSWAGGSAVFSYELNPSGKSVVLQWICTSDSVGAGSISSPTITQPGSSSLFKYNTPMWGTILGVEIIPGTGGVQPSDLYDVELQSSTDTTKDYLGGLGDNCSQTTTRWGIPIDEYNGMAVRLQGQILTKIAASNVGSAKKFTLRVEVGFD